MLEREKKEGKNEGGGCPIVLFAIRANNKIVILSTNMNRKIIAIIHICYPLFDKQNHSLSPISDLQSILKYHGTYSNDFNPTLVVTIVVIARDFLLTN